MSIELTSSEVELVIQSLEYTKRYFENYAHYPSYEFKQVRIQEVVVLLSKFSCYRKEIKNV